MYNINFLYMCRHILSMKRRRNEKHLNMREKNMLLFSSKKAKNIVINVIKFLSQTINKYLIKYFDFFVFFLVNLYRRCVKKVIIKLVKLCDYPMFYF